jgi:hypothetical protein
MAQVETIQEFVRHSEVNAKKEVKTNEAWQYLKEHPECRLALFYLPSGHTPVPTVEEVLDFYCGVLSKRPLLRDPRTGRFVCYSNLDHDDRRDRTRLLFSQPPYCTIIQNFTWLTRHGLDQNEQFFWNIIGEDALHGNQAINLDELYFRLACANNESINNVDVRRDDPDLGKVWMRYKRTKRQAIVDLQLGFPAFLREQVQGGYLDQLASVGICIDRDNPGGLVPSVVNNSTELKDSTGETASGVFSWDHPFSQEFLDFVTGTGLGEALFMNDPNNRRAGRYLRVESKDAYTQTILFQVGSDATCTLHQARVMSCMGELFLKCANWLSVQFHDYMKDELLRKYGTIVGSEYTPRLAEYDLINHQVSLKRGGTYDWHTDCRNMLCDNNKDEEGLSDFYLCVPTFVITHGGDRLSSINFRRKEPTVNPTTGAELYNKVGRIPLASESIHFQMYGCNSYFQHRAEVISDAPPGMSRWAITFRETTSLQAEGLSSLLGSRPRMIPIVGLDADYREQVKWAQGARPAQDPISVPLSHGTRGTGRGSIGLGQGGGRGRGRLHGRGRGRGRGRHGDVLIQGQSVSRGLQPISDPQSCGPATLFTLSQWQVQVEKEIPWPRPPDQKTVSSQQSLWEILCSSDAVPLLNSYKCTVTRHVDGMGVSS